MYTHSPLEVCKTLVKYELSYGQAVYERVLCRSEVKHWTKKSKGRKIDPSFTFAFSIQGQMAQAALDCTCKKRVWYQLFAKLFTEAYRVARKKIVYIKIKGSIRWEDCAPYKSLIFPILVVPERTSISCPMNKWMKVRSFRVPSARA